MVDRPAASSGHTATRHWPRARGGAAGSPGAKQLRQSSPPRPG